jgi:hypothetical protein
MLKSSNMFYFRRYGIGLLLLMSWIIQAYPVLTSKPNFVEVGSEVQKIHDKTVEEYKQAGVILPQSVPTEAPTNSVVQVLKERWIFSIVLITFGIVSSILALLQVRYWMFAVIITSLIYLVIWYSSVLIRPVADSSDGEQCLR